MARTVLVVVASDPSFPPDEVAGPCCEPEPAPEPDPEPATLPPLGDAFPPEPLPLLEDVDVAPDCPEPAPDPFPF